MNVNRIHQHRISAQHLEKHMHIGGIQMSSTKFKNLIKN